MISVMFSRKIRDDKFRSAGVLQSAAASGSRH